MFENEKAWRTCSYLLQLLIGFWRVWSEFKIYFILFQTTYKALEQLSETGFDLVKVEAVVRKTRHSQNLDSLLVSSSGNGNTTTSSSRPPSTCPIETVTRDLATKGDDKKIFTEQECTFNFVNSRCKNEKSWYSFSKRNCKRSRKAIIKVWKKYDDIWLASHPR